jgi:two-component system invasion response regulator UvrY
MTILIIDSNPLYLRALEGYMKKYPNIRILSECNAENAMLLDARLRPDVTIITTNMSPISGYEYIARGLRRNPQAKFIGLSMFYSKPIREQLESCGAKGYITRGADPDRIISIIRQIVNGETFFPENEFQLAVSSQGNQ